MASNFRIFFAGVGTTFIILAVGFGGGLMMAKSALEEPTGYRSPAPSEPLPPARVILPSTTEAALPPQTPKEQVVAASPEPSPQSQAQPAKEEVRTAVEQQVDNVDTRKAKAEERARRKRVAERKAKRLAAERAKHQHIEPDERPRGPVMAFGGDEPRQSGGLGFFGRD
jgi:type IV secretory pathway VirB10-like protein